MKLFDKLFIYTLCLWLAGPALAPPPAFADTATLLPNALQQFFNAQGKPVSNGTVEFDIPGTSTPSLVWQDPNQTTPWSNPVPLNSAGTPGFTQPHGIYGSGSYRQIVKDQYGNVIWDQLTASTGGGGGPTPVTIGDGIAVGTILPYNGLVAPANYMPAAGQLLSRTTYSALFNAITSTQSVVCTAGTAVVSNFSDTSQFSDTMNVESPCLPPGTRISSVTNSTTLTMTSNATVSGVFPITVLPAGNGDGSTTFKLPDLRGLALAGRDNLGGTAAGRLTTFFGPGNESQGLSQNGGSQSHVQTVAELVGHNHGVFLTDPGHTHTYTSPGATANVNVSAGGVSLTNPGVTATTASSTTGIVISDGNGNVNQTAVTGSAAPFTIVQPTLTTNYIIKVFPDSLGSDATWQVPLNAIPVGLGQGTGFNFVTPNPSVTPKFLQQSGDGTTASAPIFGTVSQFINVPNVAGLRGLAGGISNVVYLEGYNTPGDGGSGFLKWDGSSVVGDDGCAAFAPNVGSGRWIRIFANSIVNVRQCGAVGDGVTSDQAAVNAAAAIAISIKNSGVYFPATANCYLASLTVRDVDGFHIYGDTASNFGTTITTSTMCSNDATATLNIVSDLYSGGISNVSIDHLKLVNTGTGFGLRLWNLLWFSVSDVVAYSAAGTGATMQGIGDGTIGNFQAWGFNHGLTMGTNGGTLVGANPSATVFTGSQFSAVGGTGPALVLSDDIDGVTFIGGLHEAANVTGNCAISIDGDATYGHPAFGSVTFIEEHGESNYNQNGTIDDFCVGQTTPTGTVRIQGGLGIGNGNETTNGAVQDFVHVFGANSVIVAGSTASKLQNTVGYTRAMIRMESSFTGTYNYSNNTAQVTGTMYSDPSGRCTGTSDCKSDGQLTGTQTFTGTLGLGIAGSSIGTLTTSGNTSGTITFKSQAAAGTYNWNWPTTAGTSGQVLTSGGGAGAPMTWSTVASGTLTIGTTPISGSGLMLFNNAGTLGGVASVNSAVLATNGSGVPSLTTTLPNLNIGTPTAGVATNLTGTASGLTAGNVTTNANLTGDVTSVGNATTLTNAPVIAKVLTGFTSTTGTITSSDSILTAMQKLYGNDALKLPINNPTATGTLTVPIAVGGASAGSTLTLNGTSNGSPASAFLNLQSNGQFASIGNASPKTMLDINANLSSSPALAVSTSLIRAQAADGASGGQEWVSYLNGNTGGNILAGAVANGTAASPTATPNVSNMFNLRGYGYNSGWQLSSIIIMRSAEAWSSGHQGTAIDFYGTPIGSTSLGVAAGITGAGGLTVGDNITAVNGGEIGMVKATATASAPGAAHGKLAILAGTTAGTCKLVMYAGTSATPTTVIDNVGSGC